MKMSIMFLFLLAGLSPVHAVDENVNMVMNPSFEFKYTTNTYGKIPLYWARYSGGAGSIDIYAGRKQGDCSLKIYDSSTNANVGVWTDLMPVSPGQVYTARVWARVGTTAMVAKVYFKFFDASGTNVVLTTPSTSVGLVGGTWGEGTKTATAPTNAAFIRILLYSDNASFGVAYFDCVSLTLDDQLVSDGGFDGAATNQLPAYWSVYATHTGAVQDVQLDNGNKAIRLYDTNTTVGSGACLKIPAAPGVPYKLSASLRKADGIGSPAIHLQFFDSDDTKIGATNVATSSSVSTNLSVCLTAPAGTAYGEVICFISTTGTGTAYFDNISVTENYALRYAAPTALGSGAGTNAATAACYTNSTFWSAVNTAAGSSPVKVILLAGDYTNRCVIHGVGNANKQVVITGEKPFAVNYCASNTNTEYLYVYDCENLVFRHLHFTATEDQAKLDLKDYNIYDYQYVMRIGASSYTTKNIRCEGLTFTGLLLLAYGTTGAHYSGTHEITWDACSWARIGWDYHDHCIYNANSSSNLLVTDCYFQDDNGAYVRFRNRSKGTVQNCTFIATGTQPTGNTTGYQNYNFIHLFAINIYAGDNEIIGDDFHFNNNTFTYENTNALGLRDPFLIHVTGAPTSQTNFHLISWANGALLENTNTAQSTRIGILQTHLGVNMTNDFEVVGNTYTGCWPERFTLSCYPPTTNWWTAELQECELDDLVGID